MSKKNQNAFALLAATGLFLTSCAAARQVDVQPTPTVVNQPETAVTPVPSQPTLAPAASPTSPPTATIAPATPTVAPTSAVALTPSSAPATSASADGATLVKELLATNAQCELPCWWGIQPGSAFTSTNVETISGTLSHDVTNDLFTISVNNSDKDVIAELGYQVAVAVALSDTSVSEIRVHGSNDVALPPGSTYGHDWQEYAPPRMLTKLGVPAEVRLSTSTFGGTENLFFTLDMIYPDKGVAVRYDGFVPKRGARFMICPTMAGVAGIDGITSIDLLLTSPGDAERFNDSLSRWKPYKVDSTSPIQDAIGKSVADFYNLFKGDGPDACFEPIKT